MRLKIKIERNSVIKNLDDVIKHIQYAYEYVLAEHYASEPIYGTTEFNGTINPEKVTGTFVACTGNRWTVEAVNENLYIEYEGSRYGLIGLRSDVFGYFVDISSISPPPPWDRETREQLLRMIKNKTLEIKVIDQLHDEELDGVIIDYKTATALEWLMLPFEQPVYENRYAESRKIIGFIPLTFDSPVYISDVELYKEQMERYRDVDEYLAKHYEKKLQKLQKALEMMWKI